MIESRLSTMAGARRVSVAEIARDSGVSYGAAYALYNNSSRRVDYDTLDKLCRYFACGVGDILVYVPGRREGEAAGGAR